MTDRCPLCGQPVTKEESTRIIKQIEARVQRQAKAEAEKARSHAEQQIKAALANQEKLISQKLQTQRVALEKAKSAAVSAEREKFFREKSKLEQQLTEVQKRLQQKTANELGNEAELDLFLELNREFNDQKLFKDQIERIKKGKEGGDIIHRVIHNAQICGSILLESKNTTRFMTAYISKLRNDQTREDADHAVLVTSAFPAGAAARHLVLRDGVLIVSPRLVIAVEHLLRRQILQAHALRLGKEGRREQRDALYEFVVSAAAAELWSQFATLTTGLLLPHFAQGDLI
jgi:hypothetical protein